MFDLNVKIMRKNRIALSALASACALTFFIGLPPRATGQTNALEATPPQLKKLSLEDLMNLVVMIDGRTVFHINIEVASEAKLAISAKLLQLAEVIATEKQ